MVSWEEAGQPAYNSRGNIPEQIKKRQQVQKERIRERLRVADFLDGFKIGVACCALIVIVCSLFVSGDPLTSPGAPAALFLWLGCFFTAVALLAHLTKRSLDKTLPAAGQ